MDNQKINCTVTSCKYNKNSAICSLKEIVVTPKANCNTQNTEESMCGSYECQK